MTCTGAIQMNCCGNEAIMNKCIMALFAHADDIEIKAGGTLLKYKDQGYKIIYVMATNNMAGSDARKSAVYGQAPMPPDECYAVRRKEACAAAEILGTKPIFLDYPQGGYHKNGIFKGVELRFGSEAPEKINCEMPSILTAYHNKECVERVTQIILENQPEFVFTETADHNTEHYSTCLLCQHAFDSALKKNYKGILLSPSIPRRPFMIPPDTYVNITDYIEKKIALLKIHESQCAEWMLERLKDQAKFWGWACNCKYAEAFSTIKNGLLQ